MTTTPRGRWLRRALAVAIIAGIAFWAGRMLPEEGAAPAAQKNTAAQKDPAAKAADVTVQTVDLRDFADSIEALGTTRANETVQLTAQISDKVTEIHFQDGQVVHKGDVLLVLDNAEEKANLQAAQALADERRSAFNRARDLNDKKIISREVFEARTSEMEQADATVRSLQSVIDNTIITAPFNGVLGLRNVSLGALVQPGTVITTIDDLSQIKVDFDVPAIYLQDLKPGLHVTGTVEGLTGRAFEGEVTTVNTQVDPVTRAVTVRALMPNPELLLRPGLLMSVTLDLRQRRSLTVPETALISQREQSFVFVAEPTDDGRLLARKIEVQRGARRLGEVEILQGLESGQQVITTGYMTLADGDPVRAVADPLKAAAPADAKP